MVKKLMNEHEHEHEYGLFIVFLNSLLFCTNKNKKVMADDHIEDPFQLKLKAILELSVSIVRPRLKTKTQLAKLQEKLVDYHSNDELVEIIEEVLKILAQILPKAKGATEQEKNMIEEEEYLKLEQHLQGLEARVRLHVKNEHQLKLFCDQLEAKNKQLEDSKHQLVLSTKKTILDLKRDNQELVLKVREYHIKLQEKEKIIEGSVQQNFHSTPNSHLKVTSQMGENSSSNPNSKTDKKSHYKNPLTRKFETPYENNNGSSSKKNGLNLDRIQSSGLRNKIIDQYSNLIEQSRSRKGSVSSLKIRDKSDKK